MSKPNSKAVEVVSNPDNVVQLPVKGSQNKTAKRIPMTKACKPQYGVFTVVRGVRQWTDETFDDKTVAEGYAWELQTSWSEIMGDVEFRVGPRLVRVH